MKVGPWLLVLLGTMTARNWTDTAMRLASCAEGRLNEDLQRFIPRLLGLPTVAVILAWSRPARCAAKVKKG